MPYTSLEKIKRRLNITTAEHDALLTDLLNEADAEINFILSQHVKMPVEDEQLLNILDGIEADWVVGRYRTIMMPQTLITPEGQIAEDALLADARRRLNRFIEYAKKVIIS